MAHKHSTTSSTPDASARSVAPCAVCGTRDSRVLTAVELSGGAQVSLCANHERMYLRSDMTVATIEELRAAFTDRRGFDRRSAKGEVDELAANLTAAFTTERRVSDRRV